MDVNIKEIADQLMNERIINISITKDEFSEITKIVNLRILPSESITFSMNDGVYEIRMEDTTGYEDNDDFDEE